MSNLFPEHYDLKNLKGPRALQFDKREDAFQQLVGDALKEMGGHCVYVSPTKNQDGSIDIYLDGEFTLIEPFQDLEFPIIVECKDHDDQLSQVVQNIEKGWGKVKQKLKKHAEQGWGDLFLPWQQAKSYVYCISSLINTQTRIDLQNNIQAFFDNLPNHQRSPLQNIRVLHWDDLRHWINQLPRIVDEWLGVYLENVISLEIYKSRLSGFKQYLRKSKLEFVAPLPDNPCHPRQIMKRLNQTNDKPGVLIVGAGGVGKTRTVLEVSQIAGEQGWRVLYVLPDEPLVTAEDLAEVVLPYHCNTLLVFDYLDQMQNLDLGTLHRSLIPQAKERGLRLALLANARPKWMMTSYSERDALFDRLDLAPTKAQKAQIITKMIEFIAPQATKTLGRHQVFHLCGQRPIIALLIARELERRTYEDQLELGNIQNLRTGDLTYWLQRRLKEDDIYVEPSESIWIPSRPKPYVVAACAALACAPDSPDGLIFATESSLRKLEYDYPDHAMHIIQTLIVLGWLESDGRWLYTSHDVVADEVLDQVIFEKESIQEKELEATLSCSIKRLRSLGRFAKALNRVIGSKENEAAENLQMASENWLIQNASALGQLAKETNTDVASYALGAVIAGPPWSETAIQTWEDLIAPWLEVNGQKLVARHLLYKGLKHVDEIQTSIALMKTSINWLHENAEHILASFVFAPLLARTDLVGDVTKKSITLAVSWLDKHYEKLDAQFVLNPLLARTDLGNHAEQSIELAVSWLDKHYEKLDAQFVLNPLLARTDLGNHAEQSIELALLWLDSYLEKPDAGFVLNPLLARTDLVGDVTKKSITLAVSWLDKHYEKLDAQFVLNPLLARTDLGNHAEQSIELAVSWLDKHYEKLDAQFVLNPLLARTDLGNHAEQSIELALLWLDKYHKTLGAGFVLPPLLSRTDLEKHVGEVIQFALVWLETGDFYQSTDAEFVLKHLLQKEQLPEAQKNRLIRVSLERIRTNLENDEATFLIRSCMRSWLNDEKLIKDLFDVAIQWLEAHPRHSEKDYVFNKLLRRPRLANYDWKRVAKIALDWLESVPKDHPQRDHAISSLHRRCVSLLDSTDFEYLIDETIKWLKEHKDTDEGFKGLLRSLRGTFGELNTHHPRYQEIKELIENKSDRFEYYRQLLIDHIGKSEELVDAEIVRSALNEFKKRTAVSPASAGYMIPALLTIAVQLESELADEIRKTVYDTISDERYKDNQKGGMLRECLQMMKEGRFHPKEKALRILNDVGLKLGDNNTKSRLAGHPIIAM